MNISSVKDNFFHKNIDEDVKYTIKMKERIQLDDHWDEHYYMSQDIEILEKTIVTPLNFWPS